MSSSSSHEIVSDSLTNANEPFEGEVLINGFDVPKAYIYAKEHPDESAAVALTNLGMSPTQGNISKYNFWTKTARLGFLEFAKFCLDKLPLLLFLFIPIMALVLKLLYFRHGIYYSEHLTFLFQTNSMVFILTAVGVLVEYYFDTNLAIVCFVLFSLYFLLSMKHFYGQGWLKTIIKYLINGIACMFLLPVFSGLALAIAYYIY